MRVSLVCGAAHLIGLASATGVFVHPGQSIQAAIDAASPGTKIVVKAGTYAEQLTISKDGIELVAYPGAVLVPPPSPVTNKCTGLAGTDPVTGIVSNAGICVIGTGVVLADFVREHRKVTDVGAYVSGVRVKDFDIRGFVGLGIAVVGAKNTEIRSNTVFDGTTYGILTVGSINTEITRNTIRSSDLKFIGICMDDKSNVKVTWNSISDYMIALCVQTNGAEVAQNTVSNSCFGVLVDPLIDGARVLHNHISRSNPLCNPYFGNFTSGIVLASALNARVHNNDVFGMSDGGDPDKLAAGILIYDDPAFGVATGNKATYNTLYDNEQDIVVLSAGDNDVSSNKCSTPAELC